MLLLLFCIVRGSQYVAYGCKSNHWQTLPADESIISSNQPVYEKIVKDDLVVW